MRYLSRIHLFTAIIVIIMIAMYAIFIEPNSLHKSNITITSDKIKKPVRIAFLSDIHAPVSTRMMQQIVNAIAQFSPNVILIAGDINEQLKTKEPSVEFLNSLVDETGIEVFLVMGDADVCSRLGQCMFCATIYKKSTDTLKATILRDSTLFLPNNISISGLDYFTDDNWSPPDFSSNIPDSVFRLLLLHNTANIQSDYFSHFDLSLSGNTHGGQVFMTGKILSLFDNELDGRYIKGLYTIGKSTLLVNSGIGTSFLPIRFGVIPEIILLTIEGSDHD